MASAVIPLKDTLAFRIYSVLLRRHLIYDINVFNMFKRWASSFFGSVCEMYDCLFFML